MRDGKATQGPLHAVHKAHAEVWDCHVGDIYKGYLQRLPVRFETVGQDAAEDSLQGNHGWEACTGQLMEQVHQRKGCRNSLNDRLDNQSKDSHGESSTTNA